MAAPRAGGEEGRERRSGSCPAQWRTRRGDGETAARRRLLLARMGNRGGGGGASAAAASTGGTGKRVRAGEQVGPSSLRALLSLLSDFTRAPLSTRASSLRAGLLFSPILSPALPRFPAASIPYGARLARSGKNRTPKRRFPDATGLRRTPYEFEASRLPNRLAWSALAIRRRQSDAKATP